MPPKRTRKPRSRGWCATIHYSADALELTLSAIANSFFTLDELEYAIIGDERGSESLTEHLQCYFKFRNARSSDCITQHAATIHGLKTPYLQQAKGTAKQNHTYCSKEARAVFEHGELPAQGKRTDLNLFMEDVESGQRSKKQLIRDHPSVFARARGFVDEYLAATAPKPKTPDIVLKAWQATLIQTIKVEPHPRRISVVVDPTGCGGKTTFARYIASLFDNVQLLSPGKHADLSYILDDSTRVLIMDSPRETNERIPWSFLEKVKDGFVLSTKYQPVNKFLGPVHVLVFTNTEPDRSALSADRWHVINI